MFRIRRTLIVGLGERGARVAGLVHHELNARTGGLPVLRCLAVVPNEAAIPPGVAGLALAPPSSPEPREGETVPAGPQSGSPEANQLVLLLNAELLEAHRLAHDRDCARRGWPVAPGPGVAAYVVADLGDPMAAAGFVALARLVQEVAERRVSQGTSLCGVVLLPDPTGSPEEIPCLSAAHLALQSLEEAQAAALRSAFAWSDGDDGNHAAGETSPFPLFNEGCYLLTVTNEDGLTADGEIEMDEMVAAWLIELLLTPLALALDRRTPLGGGADFGSFGLARWRFPATELAAHLAARFQVEMLDALLGPSGGAERPALAASWHNGCPPPLWPAGPRFPVTPEHFTPPDLQRLGQLIHEVDAAVVAAADDLRSAAQARDTALEEAVADSLAALQAEAEALVDAPGGGLVAVATLLESLARAWQQQRAQAADQAAETRQRLAGLAEPLAEVRAELESVLALFPRWGLAAWLRLLARPWRILRLLLAYHEIGEQVAAYLSIHQARWLLDAEALEADWQAAFYRRLAEAAKERLERARRSRQGIADLHEKLSASPTMRQDDVDRLLEANALPSSLAGYYYRRAVGDARQASAALLAVYGPLSRWLAEDLPLAELEQLTGEYAAERFSFLQDEVRLDELLARTYTGDELKARLRELLAAAQPFWAGEKAPMTPDERTVSAVTQFVGLPRPEDSPLEGLLAETGADVSLYAGGDRHCLTAVQVRRGLPLHTLRVRADYQAAWKMAHQQGPTKDAGQ